MYSEQASAIQINNVERTCCTYYYAVCVNAGGGAAAAAAVARKTKSEISEAGNALECASVYSSVYMIQNVAL